MGIDIDIERMSLDVGVGDVSRWACTRERRGRREFVLVSMLFACVYLFLPFSSFNLVRLHSMGKKEL